MLRALCAASAPRFVLVGLAMTVLNLALFRGLSPLLVAELANLSAFLLVTQVNFAVSYLWTWSSRRVAAEETVRSVLRRALAFNGSATLGFGVNALVFSLTHRVAGTSPMVSAVLATSASAAANFLLSSLVVFRRPPLPAPGAAAVVASVPLGSPYASAVAETARPL
jgi:putative flippase GtrA